MSWPVLSHMLLKFTVFRGLLVFREGIPKKMKQSNFYIFSGHKWPNPQKVTPPHGLRTFGNFTYCKKKSISNQWVGQATSRGCVCVCSETPFFAIHFVLKLSNFLNKYPIYRVVFLLFRPKKWLSVRLHCKSHQKSSKCQIFQLVWHLVIFRAEQ